MLAAARSVSDSPVAPSPVSSSAGNGEATCCDCSRGIERGSPSREPNHASKTWS